MTHFVDVEYGEPMWGPALYGAGLESSGQQMLKAFNQEGKESFGAIFGPLKGITSAVHSLVGNVYGDEIDELSEIYGFPVRDIVSANLVYDASSVAGLTGCSTFAVPTREGPLHARTLDWYFPRNLLRKHATVLRMIGAPRGDYLAVTWPGLVGILTGVAIGRFSISVNQVTNPDDSSKWGFAKRAVTGSWPVMFAVRKAFDECKDFKAAVRMLKNIPLLSPVLFTVVGIHNADRVVLERTTDDCVIRKASGNKPICVTNHYLEWEWDDDEEEDDSGPRYGFLRKHLTGRKDINASSAIRLLGSGDIESDITAYAAVMEPLVGRLTVRVPGEKAKHFMID